MVGAVHGAWSSFVRDGRPDMADWAKYEGHRSPVCIFDRETKVKQLDRTELMDAWGDMRFYEE